MDNQADLTFLSLMVALKRLVQKEFRRSARGMQGCSFVQLETLHFLKERQGAFANEVAKHFLISPPAATLLVDGLVAPGFVARSFDKKDRRAVRLAITKKGEILLRQAGDRRAKIFRKIFSVLSAEEKTAFAAILKKIAYGNRRNGNGRARKSSSS